MPSECGMWRAGVSLATFYNVMKSVHSKWARSRICIVVVAHLRIR